MTDSAPPEATPAQAARYNFCAVLGADYVLRILALHRSLTALCPEFALWICCIDRVAYDTLAHLRLPHAHLLSSGQIEDDVLRALRKRRNVSEYCWTLKSVLMEHLLERQQLPSVVYCDTDMFFFADPTAIFQEWADRSVFLCTQRDRPDIEAIYGKYQAGLFGAKNDDVGLATLRWWKERCIEWCSRTPEDGKFGDQKYLDEVPIRFSNVLTSNHLGIDAAPWNCVYNNHFHLDLRGGQVYIEEHPLIAYHFACMEVFDDHLFELWSIHSIAIPPFIREHIYLPYLSEIRSITEGLGSDAAVFFSRKDPVSAKTLYKESALRTTMDQWETFYHLCTTTTREYLPRAIALYESLARHGANFMLWICCVDEESYRILQGLALPNVRVLAVAVLEDAALKHIRGTRTVREYCWTLKSCLLEHILTKHFEVNALVYCDADTYFFGGPKTLFDLWATRSVLLCTQRAPAEVEHTYGLYQSGIIGFKRDTYGLTVLRCWKQKCLDWCFERFDQASGRWGDQRYLTYVPNLFSNIGVVRDPGIAAGPWNLVMDPSRQVEVREGRVYVEGDTLTCYHFGGMVILGEARFDLWKHGPLAFPDEVVRHIYLPYLQHLEAVLHRLREEWPEWRLTDGPPGDGLYTPANPFQDGVCVVARPDTESDPQPRRRRRWSPVRYLLSRLRSMPFRRRR